MVCIEETEGIGTTHIQVRQSDACVQAAALLAAPNVDGIALVGEEPGLAVDCRGCQTGRLQSGIGLVRNLLHGLALEALQIVAQLVALGVTEGQHNNEFHAIHSGSRLGIHPSHTQPADTQTQSLQVQIHLLEQEADVLQGHTAMSREIFAQGAITAAKFICGKDAGLYDMKKLIAE